MVFGDGTNGYVSDDGRGSAPLPPVPLAPAGEGHGRIEVVVPACGLVVLAATTPG